MGDQTPGGRSQKPGTRKGIAGIPADRTTNTRGTTINVGKGDPKASPSLTRSTPLQPARQHHDPALNNGQR